MGLELSEAIEQRDMIFFRKGKSFADLQEGEPVIRIRREDGGTKVTIKKYVSGVTNREETECNVSDAVLFEKFLEMLDCVHVVSVNKTRIKGIYKGAEITVDKVSELGDYAEIEIMSSEEDVKMNLKKLESIVKELELDMKNLTKVPYDEMLFMKEKKDD